MCEDVGLAFVEIVMRSQGIAALRDATRERLFQPAFDCWSID
jgi:hypothetical protein